MRVSTARLAVRSSSSRTKRTALLSVGWLLLSGALLSGALLSGALLSGALLSGALLSGASLPQRSLGVREGVLASGLLRALGVGVVAALLGAFVAWRAGVRRMDRLVERLRAERDEASTQAQDRHADRERLRHAEHLVTVGTLAAGVAHELGTPLHVVIARARRIVKRDLDDVTTREAESIVQEGERMSRLIRQLVDFSQPRGQRRGHVTLRSLAHATTTTLRPIAAARQVRLELDAAADGDIEGDPEALSQMLSNLVLNGIQASGAGHTVTVAVREPIEVPRGDGARTYARLAVSDDGPGIPDAVKKRLFEPFFTTREVGEGSGLGLSVAWGIAREHGGFIDVSSEPGAGSRFTVHLPLPEREAPREPAGVTG